MENWKEVFKDRYEKEINWRPFYEIIVFIEKLLDKQYLKMAHDINLKLNKVYRSDLQEMQEQKNRVMAINIKRTKEQCAYELEEISKEFDCIPNMDYPRNLHVIKVALKIKEWRK